jgi:hypothetical protein
MSLTPATKAKAIDNAIRHHWGRDEYNIPKLANLLAMLTSASKDEREAGKRQVRELVKTGSEILQAENAAQDLANFANRNEP